MIKYRLEETIQRPVDEVFRYLADPTLHSKWSPVSDVQVVPPGEIRVGTTVREMMKMGSKMAPFSYRVTEYRRGASFSFHGIEGPMTWDGSYAVEPAGPGSTRVIGLGSVGLKGWQRLLEPFMGGEIRRGEAAELGKLKALLEEEG
ncbi:MAG TPA: SRPBCC family protein [Candidatus Limnocylindria bacterium]|nr:SRPBCC family protein [Candidatus Limnocylindria bacterium]